MQLSPLLKTAASIAALCLSAYGQAAPAAAAKDAANEMKGMPPRTAPTEYQSHAQAGTVTIAAEFTGHNIGTPQGTLTTEDYVVVETAFFGGADARTKLSADDFSLRINGKKAIPAQPYALVFGSLKDPEWEPPASTKEKSKSSMSAGGGGGGGKGEDAPAPPKMSFPERRAMEQKVQKATLPEGDRALPVAGLIYFNYRGNAKGIKSIELLYTGPAGKATLTMAP